MPFVVVAVLGNRGRVGSVRDVLAGAAMSRETLALGGPQLLYVLVHFL